MLAGGQSAVVRNFGTLSRLRVGEPGP